MNLHPRLNLAKDGGADKIPVLVTLNLYIPAIEEQFGPLPDSGVDHFMDEIPGLGGDYRPHHHTLIGYRRIKGIGGDNPACCRNKGLGDLCIGFIPDTDNGRCGHTALPRRIRNRR